MEKDHETSPETLSALCAVLDFGRATPDERGAAFYALLNDAVTGLVRSLPRSTQSSAMIFAMHYAGLHLGEPLDFFRNYYSPIWSSIPHVIKKWGDTILPEDFIGHAARGHAMAMLLHSLDDHLNDGEVPASHLALLIRSQAWKILHDSLTPLADAVSGGADTAAELLDEYYSGITSEDRPADLEGYLKIFRKQMATGLIIPLLSARLAGGSVTEQGVRASLESFGIAWRILDDIRDMEHDCASGHVSAVSLCLPEEGRRLCSAIGLKHESDRAMDLESMVRNHGIIDTLVKRLLSEMGDAASHADFAGLTNLSTEFRVLAAPLHTILSGKAIQEPGGA